MDDLPFIPPDFTILAVVPVNRIFLVAFLPAGRKFYPFLVLVKVIDLAALEKSFPTLVHCPHGQHDMNMRVMSRWMRVMDGEINNHAFGNKLGVPLCGRRVFSCESSGQVVPMCWENVKLEFISRSFKY